MSPRVRAALQIAVLLAWQAVVAVLFLVAVYPRVGDDGWAVLVQAVAYLLILVPVLLLRPRVRLPLGMSGPAAALAVLVLVAAVVVSGVVDHATLRGSLDHAGRAVTAGVAEEVLFRGAVFDRLRTLLRSAPLRTLVDALLFTASHAPLLVVHHEPITSAIPIVVTGLVLSAVRAVSGGLLLPAALHVAIDLST